MSEKEKERRSKTEQLMIMMPAVQRIRTVHDASDGCLLFINRPSALHVSVAKLKKERCRLWASAIGQVTSRDHAVAPRSRFAIFRVLMRKVEPAVLSDSALRFVSREMSQGQTR